MARKCSLCEHDDLAEINSALASNEPLRYIADRWSVSKTELMRHRNQHLPVSALTAQEAEEVTHSDDFLDEIRDLQERTQGALERGQKAEELSVALQAISEARDNLELLAELLDELDESGDETDLLPEN
jgi:hypothetical protein